MPTPNFIKIVIIIKKDNKYHQSDGYCLSYNTETGLYKFTNITHCSCNGSGIGTILHSDEEHDKTYEEINKLAQTRGDPRVPDAPMYLHDDQLEQIYDYILTKKNEEELLNDACVHRYCSDDESDGESHNASDNESDDESDSVDEHMKVINVYDYLCKKGYHADANLNRLPIKPTLQETL
jgi:hypothetical protein